MSESESSSLLSDAEHDLRKLEVEITKQTNDINNFIMSHARNHKHSETYEALKQLYDIFTKQVEHNWKLRREISSAKVSPKSMSEQTHKLESAIKSFINRLESNSGRTIPDLDTAADFLENEITRMIIEEKALTEFREISGQRNLMQRQIQASSDRIKALQQIMSETEAEHSLLLASLNAKTENAGINITSIRAQIEEYESRKRDLVNEMSISESGAKVYKDRISAQESEVKQKVDNFRELSAKRSAKLENMENNLASLESDHSRITREKHGIIAALEEAKRELAIIEKKVASEMREIGGKMRLVETDLMEETAKLEKILSAKRKLVAANDSLLARQKEQKRTASEIKAKMVSTKARMKALDKARSQLEEDIQSCKMDVMRFRGGSPASVEELIEEKSRINQEIMTENKRLESQLRVTMNDAERLVRENARLQALLNHKK